MNRILIIILISISSLWGFELYADYKESRAAANHKLATETLLDQTIPDSSGMILTHLIWKEMDNHQKLLVTGSYISGHHVYLSGCEMDATEFVYYVEFLQRLKIGDVIKHVDKHYQTSYLDSVAEIITQYLEERFNAFKGFPDKAMA